MRNDTTPLTLGTEPISKLLIQYAIPSIIAMTVSSIYNITDSIFIGHGVGAIALSGLAITFPLMNLGAAFGSLVGVGGSALLSMRLGQKDYKTANIILGNVITLNVLIGLLFSVFTIIFLKPILFFFGASDDTLPYAYSFMMIILAGNVVSHLFWGLNALLRSAGKPQQAMFSMIFTVLINLVLNPLFIFVFKWGIQGSAIATIIAQVIMLAWEIRFFSDKSFFIHIKSGIFKLHKKIVVDALSIGLSPFMMNAAACVIVILINQNLKYYGGDLAVGAYGIVNRMGFLFIMIVMGLNQGMQPIIGYNYGAKQYDRVTESFRKTVIIACAVLTLGFIIVELFPHSVASIFTTEKELADLSAVGLRFTFTFFPIIGFQMVASAFFQSIGKVSKAIILSLTRQVIFLIPFLLVLPKYYQITGVWVSLPLSDLLATFLAIILIIVQFRQLKSLKSK
jgi:putative MATE family efflux protein